MIFGFYQLCELPCQRLIKTTSVRDVVRRKVLALLLCEPLSIHLKRDVGPAWAGFMWRPEMSFGDLGVSSYFQSIFQVRSFAQRRNEDWLVVVCTCEFRVPSACPLQKFKISQTSQTQQRVRERERARATRNLRVGFEGGREDLRFGFEDQDDPPNPPSSWGCC